MRVVWPGWASRARPLCVLAAGALLAGCHSSNIAPPGTPVITMSNPTNTKDFAAYIVNLDAITLTATDGSVATPLLTPMTVDLVRLNDLAELVEAPAVPAATYTSATLTLNYSLASIWINDNGTPVLATPLSPAGAAVGVVSVTVTFDPKNPLVITKGISTRVQVEVDLAASNSISTATSPPTVIVQPFLAITPAQADTTVLRARGLFVVTQPTSGNFIMNLRPFYNLVSALGSVFVSVNSSTYYNIEGVAYTGAAGLSALATELQNTPVVAYGTLSNLSGITPYFNATAVYAGASQESPLAYYATGIVSSRNADVINLQAVELLLPFPTVVYPLDVGFRASLPVTLGAGTIVSQDGGIVPGLNITSVSVGQRINVSGQGALSSLGDVTALDATAGHVRLATTPLWGTLNPGATAGQASLCLQSLGDLPTSVFTFTGTGSAGHDAAPAAYQVKTGSFNASTLPAGACGAGTLLQAQGTVAPFGSAPPDFSATLVTPSASTQQQLLVEWINGGAAAPFSSMSAAGLVVDLTNPDLGTLHHVRSGPATLDLTDVTKVPTSPLITTANQSQLQLVVGSTALTTGFSVFNNATGFAAGLHAAFNGTNKIYRLVAYGQCTTSSTSACDTFVASRIHVALHE